MRDTTGGKAQPEASVRRIYCQSTGSSSATKLTPWSLLVHSGLGYAQQPELAMREPQIAGTVLNNRIDISIGCPTELEVSPLVEPSNGRSRRDPNVSLIVLKK